ncbi:MAG: ABC transporter ATP-binding protein [bacterium]
MSSSNSGAANALGPAIQIQNLAKNYGAGINTTHAIDALTLDIAPGAFVALTGRSGSGKTTLLNLIGGLDRPTSGSLRVGGREIAQLSEDELTLYRRDTVGFVFQFFQLLPTLCVLENVALPAWLAGRADREPHARELLARVGLAGKERSLPHELSGGEQQRVAIARALVNSPSLLLADEPTGNLDRATGASILALIREITSNRAMTIVMVTHSAEAARAADLIVPLADGKLGSATA